MQIQIQQVCREAWDYAFLKSSQRLLMVQVRGPDFEYKVVSWFHLQLTHMNTILQACRIPIILKLCFVYVVCPLSKRATQISCLFLSLWLSILRPWSPDPLLHSCPKQGGLIQLSCHNTSCCTLNLAFFLMQHIMSSLNTGIVCVLSHYLIQYVA